MKTEDSLYQQLGTNVFDRFKNDVSIITHDVTLIDLSRHQIPERATHLFLIPSLTTCSFVADTSLAYFGFSPAYWYPK
jgi:hypothetical protein